MRVTDSRKDSCGIVRSAVWGIVMKKLFLSGIALIVLAAPSMAADLAPYYKAPVPVPVCIWCGWYIGVTAGVASSTADVTLSPVNGPAPDYRSQDLPGVASLGTQSINGSGGIFGGRVGYNTQFGGWVAGLEGDFSSFNFNKTIAPSGNPFSFGGFAAGSMLLSESVSTSWLSTVRGRLGYAFNSVLAYGTGGVAFGKVGFTQTDREFSFNGLGFGNEASTGSVTKTGWAAGGGVEYAVTPNWIISLEYLHVDLGTVNSAGVVTSRNATTATLDFSTSVTSDIVRGGLAYKF
jgi:outer membrane immunogenic protein